MGADKEVILWVLGLIFTAAFSALKLRQKFWRDNAEQSETTSGHNAAIWWRDEAQLQRQRADAAYAERNKAMEELGALREQVKFLRIRVEQLEGQVTILQNGYK